MRHIIQNGSLEGDEPIVLVEGDRISNDDKQPCPHCYSPIKIIHTRSDFSTWEEINWTNPFSALIPYDGNCCHTSICIKCLLDGIKDSGFNIDMIKREVITEFNDIPVFTKIETVLLKNDEWLGHEGCIWIKGGNRLAYEHNEQDKLSWNLNGKEVKFMEQIIK